MPEVQIQERMNIVIREEKVVEKRVVLDLSLSDARNLYLLLNQSPTINTPPGVEPFCQDLWDQMKTIREEFI